MQFWKSFASFALKDRSLEPQFSTTTMEIEKEIVQRNYGYMSGASTIDILTQDLPAGTYTIELVLNNTIMQKKFVKM